MIIILLLCIIVFGFGLLPLIIRTMVAAGASIFVLVGAVLGILALIAIGGVLGEIVTAIEEPIVAAVHPNVLVALGFVIYIGVIGWLFWWVRRFVLGEFGK